MSHIPLPEPASLPTDLVVALDRLAAPVNMGLITAHSPGLVPPMVDFGLALLRDLELSGRHRELLAMLVASHAGNAYLRALHLPFAEALGVPEADLDGAYLTAPDRSGYSPEDAAVLEAGRQLLLSDTVDEAALADLREHLTDRQAVEVMCVVGYYRMLAAVTNGARVPVDSDEVLKAIDDRAKAWTA